MKKNLQSLIVSVGGTLLDALQAIDKGACEIALVVDEKARLIGTLTDGDARRALLSGANLSDSLISYYQPNFNWVEQGAGRAQVLDLMRALTISQVPELDSEKRLISLHLLHEVIGSVPKPNWAVIMAGGKGTRLGELTKSIPKPMLKVAGRPIIERLVLHLVGCGIRRIFISTNYLASVIEDHFQDGAKFGCRIEYLRENADQPLGTGGSLALLPEIPEHPVFVCNGDLVTQIDVASMLAFHESGGFLATIGVRTYTHEIPFGCLEVDESRVMDIVEKPTFSQLINAGIYMLSPDIIRRVPRAFFPITNLFSTALSQGDQIGAFEIADDWIDVGQREQLKQARGGAH
jgi:dTDP-glucose pyrophosphorylase